MKIKQIVESLRHLDSRAVDQLVSELIDTGRFELSDKYSPFSMFLLPDGSFLNAVDIWGSPIQKPGHTMLNRDQMHSEIYDILRNTDKRIRMIGDEDDNDDRPMPMYSHPVRDPEIAQYYNIIYLAVWHTAKYAIVPKGVEPTEAQHAMLRYLYTKKGFKVDTDGQDDYHLMPAHLYRDYARRKFLNESISPDKVKSTLYAHYGTTDYLPDTGFIAPDGDCIDLKRSYGLDDDDNWDPMAEEIEWHSGVTDVLNYEVSSMYELVQDYGYIRAFGDFGIELISEPTPAQYRTIKAMASNSFKRRGKFYVDIIAYFDDTSDRKENNVFERKYGHTADSVVKFIKQHFNPIK